MRYQLMLCLALWATGCAAAPPVVSVDGESLAGQRLDASGVSVFRGIPYAAAPVGALRWEKPQPYVAKPGRRDATRFAPACMQTMRILDWYRDLAESFGADRSVFDDLEISEDCLYLNVWMPPAGGADRAPVMVYVHGGSNNSGWSYEPDYHGHSLAARGVVVVSVAYRLGAFGFFSHPELDDANFGLWDQLAALQWVQRHIASFGGDPGNVTVFGESAGAQDIVSLLASGRTNGLVHRAILQSTAGFGGPRRAPRSLDDERRRGIEAGALFGIDGPGAVAALRAVDATRLLAAYEAQADYVYHSPVVDGQLLRAPAWQVLKDGGYPAIPIIIGTNADEYYASAPAGLAAGGLSGIVAGRRWLNSAEALAEIAGEPDPREAFDRLQTAEVMLCPSREFAARQGNARMYYFTRVREGERGAAVRAYHGAELPYAFDTHGAWTATTARDRELAAQMATYWTQFAATGDPNGNGLPDWPLYREPGSRVMAFGDRTVAAPAPEPVLCRLFRDALAAAP